MDRFERQQKLYKFLVENDGFRGQREIYENVEGYIWFSNAYDKCPQIMRDMVEINNNTDFDRIIVMKNREFKAGDEEDIKRFYNYHLKKLIRNRDQCLSIRRKMNRNKQGHIENGDLEFYETYIQRDED